MWSSWATSTAATASPSPAGGPYVLEGVVEFDQEKGEPFIRLERVWKANE